MSYFSSIKKLIFYIIARLKPLQKFYLALCIPLCIKYICSYYIKFREGKKPHKQNLPKISTSSLYILPDIY